jgi:hypothetical protein
MRLKFAKLDTEHRDPARRNYDAILETNREG